MSCSEVEQDDWVREKPGPGRQGVNEMCNSPV